MFCPTLSNLRVKNVVKMNIMEIKVLYQFQTMCEPEFLLCHDRLLIKKMGQYIDTFLFFSRGVSLNYIILPNNIE